MDYEVNEPKPGFYEFNDKENFEKCYEEHKDCIDNGLADGSLEIVCLDDVGDTIVSAEPTNEGNLTQVLKILPDKITVHLKKV